MKVGAIHQKSIEILLDFFSQSSQPLDRFLKALFAKNRYIGSSDRRNITSLIYGILSIKQLLHEGYNIAQPINLDDCNRSAVYWRHMVMLYVCHINNGYDGFLSSWDGSLYSPLQIDDDEISLCERFLEYKINSITSVLNVPQWLYDFASIDDHIWVEQNQKPHVDLWVNTSKISASLLKDKLQKMDVDFVLNDFGPLRYLRLNSGSAANLYKCKLYEQGMFEFQDAGSQALSNSLPPLNGRVLEMCAGAGGKTLNLALKIKSMPKTMGDRVKLFITDINSSRLERAIFRLKRAGLDEFVTPISYDERFNFGPYDGIFIDAPCSGTGVWRRHPEDRWLLTQERLSQLISIQKNLLAESLNHINKSGWVAYATCSVLPQENIHVLDYVFSTTADCFKTEHIYLSPAKTFTDAFFMATIKP